MRRKRKRIEIRKMKVCDHVCGRVNDHVRRNAFILAVVFSSRMARSIKMDELLRPI